MKLTELDRHVRISQCHPVLELTLYKWHVSIAIGALWTRAV